MKPLKKPYYSPILLRKLYRLCSSLFHRQSRSMFLWHRYWKFINAFLPERTLTVNTPHGRPSFSSKNKVIGRSLFVERQYGYADLLRAIDILKLQHKLLDANQDYMIDVGTNIGLICVPLVMNGVFKKALAFEPEPRNFGYLKRNITLLIANGENL